MKCLNCGHDNNELAKFCSKCGTKVTEKENVVNETKIKTTDEEIQELNEMVGAQENNPDEVKTNELSEKEVTIKSNEENKTKEKLKALFTKINEYKSNLIGKDKKTLTMTGIVLGGVLVIVLLLFGLSGNKSIPVDLRNAPVAYSADYDCYIKEFGKEPVKIKDSIQNDYITTRNAKDYFMLTEDDKLYHYKNGELEKIEKDVETYTVSPDGKQVFFIADMEIEGGELYYYENGDVESIESDVAQFELSNEGKMVAFIKDYSYFDGGELYLYDFSGEPEKIEKDVIKIAKVLDNGGIYYLDEDKSLYYVKGSNRERISKDVDDFVFSTKGDKIAWTDEDGDLYIKKGNKEEEKVEKDIGYMYLKYSALNNNNLDLMYRKNNNLYILMENAKSEIKLDDSYNYSLADYGDSLCYVDDGELYISEYKGKKWNEKQIETDEDVVSAFISPFGDYIVYIDFQDRMFIWDGSSKLIDEDADWYVNVYDGEIKLSPYNKTVVYINNDGDLKISKNGGEGKEIAKDIDEFYTNDFKHIYAVNDDDEIVEVKVGRDEEIVEEDFDNFIDYITN